MLETTTENYPLIPTIVLSASNNKNDMQRALATGVMGYIAKNSTSELMLNVINIVLSGGIYIPPDMVAYQKQEEVKRTEPLIFSIYIFIL